ncbi:MAG: hypothetical protein ACREMB_07105, partial [Candidatus Rokuibacteriota bacterium]
MLPAVTYDVLVLAVLAMLALVALLFGLLLAQRALASLVARHRRRREAALAPLLHRALGDPAAVPALARALRRFDQGVLRRLLLRLALDLRGEELQAIAGLCRD